MTSGGSRRILTLLAAAAFAGPLLFMVATSLQPEGEGLTSSPTRLLERAEPANYRAAVERMGDFPTLFMNTLVITILCIVGQMITCSLAGYAFACIRFRGRELLFLLVLATMLLPDQVPAIPRFLLFRALGAVDTWHPLVLPAVLGGAPFWPPFFIFLFRQYFRSLPPELIEAARIDGCGHFRIWWSVMLPLSKPMLATVAIFTFLATWNDLWQPLIYIMSPEKRTLTLALAGFNRTYNTAVEHMMAATTVVLLPCLVVYFLTQRLFMRGVRVAASKR